MSEKYSVMAELAKVYKGMGKRPTGAGARRDSKLLKAERNALSMQQAKESTMDANMKKAAARHKKRKM